MTSDEESNFRNFFNDINDFLFVLDLNGDIIETNNAVVSLLGYSKDELIGQSVLFIHPPEFREKAQKTVGDMISGKSKSCRLPIIAKNGEYIPVETRVYQGVWNSEKALIGVSRNLSEITLSEDKFFKVFNDSQVTMAISEVETGIYINVNKQFVKMLGYTKDEIIGKSSKDLKLFYDYNQRDELLKRFDSNEIIENAEIIVQTKSGEQLICLFTIKKIQIQTHNYLLTSANNITQEKVIENKIKHSLRQQTLLASISQNLNSIQNLASKINETLSLLGNHTNVSRVYIFEDDAEGKCTTNTYEWCNVGILPQIEELFAISYDFIPSWKKIFKENGRIFSVDIKELPEDIFQVLEPQMIKSILVYPLYVQEKFYGFIGFDECIINKNWEQDEIELLRIIANIISNAFERMKFQKQLIESENQLKRAIENTEAGVWDWNIETGHVYFNDIWCQMLGFEKSEIEPHIRSWKRLVHPDDLPLINEALDKHFAGETESYHTSHRLLCKTGEWIWVVDKGKIIERDKSGKPTRAIGTHIDITNQKKTEKELQVANATKDKFFSIIGHDLRGPIGALMQISELISEKGVVDEETLYSMLDSQKVLSKSTFQLLENLLNWANYNMEHLEYNPKIINLNKVIIESIDNIKYVANKKNIFLSIDFFSHINVFADEDMLNLIIRNLLSNALKFTPQGGLIVIKMIKNVSFIEIIITDSGVGITKENIEKILSDDEFHTTRGTANEKGTGLGLKLCKSFIIANHGTLKIESELNKGSKFSFTLPTHV